jgi:hypothetical protein
MRPSPREVARPMADVYGGHIWQPFFIEGCKTLACEIWRDSDFRRPIPPLRFRSRLRGIVLPAMEARENRLDSLCCSL